MKGKILEPQLDFFDLKVLKMAHELKTQDLQNWTELRFVINFDQVIISELAKRIWAYFYESTW